MSSPGRARAVAQSNGGEEYIAVNLDQRALDTIQRESSLVYDIVKKLEGEGTARVTRQELASIIGEERTSNYWNFFKARYGDRSTEITDGKPGITDKDEAIDFVEQTAVALSAKDRATMKTIGSLSVYTDEAGRAFHLSTHPRFRPSGNAKDEVAYEVFDLPRGVLSVGTPLSPESLHNVKSPLSAKIVRAADGQLSFAYYKTQKPSAWERPEAPQIDKDGYFYYAGRGPKNEPGAWYPKDYTKNLEYPIRTLGNKWVGKVDDSVIWGMVCESPTRLSYFFDFKVIAAGTVTYVRAFVIETILEDGSIAVEWRESRRSDPSLQRRGSPDNPALDQNDQAFQNNVDGEAHGYGMQTVASQGYDLYRRMPNGGTVFSYANQASVRRFSGMKGWVAGTAQACLGGLINQFADSTFPDIVSDTLDQAAKK